MEHNVDIIQWEDSRKTPQNAYTLRTCQQSMKKYCVPRDFLHFDADKYQYCVCVRSNAFGRQKPISVALAYLVHFESSSTSFMSADLVMCSAPTLHLRRRVFHINFVAVIVRLDGCSYCSTVLRHC